MSGDYSMPMSLAPNAGPRRPLRDHVEGTGRSIVSGLRSEFMYSGEWLYHIDATEWVPTGGAWANDGAYINVFGETHRVSPC